MGALVGAQASDRAIVGSVLTRTELLGGMRSAEKARTFALFDAVRWVEVDVPIANRAGELARHFRRSHAAIDIADYVIAATAQCLGAELWTRNIKHFPMFEGLVAPYELDG